MSKVGKSTEYLYTEERWDAYEAWLKKHTFRPRKDMNILLWSAFLGGWEASATTSKENENE